MLKIPSIDPKIKIVNQVLQPYFDSIASEIRPLIGLQRHKRLQMYRQYIENEARSSKRMVVRMQLRINLSSLLERFNYYGPETEVNVIPKKMSFLSTLSEDTDDEEKILKPKYKKV